MRISRLFSFCILANAALWAATEKAWPQSGEGEMLLRDLTFPPSWILPTSLQHYQVPLVLGSSTPWPGIADNGLHPSSQCSSVQFSAALPPFLIAFTSNPIGTQPLRFTNGFPTPTEPTDSPGKHRSVPNYSGLAPEPLTAAQIFLWGPRIVFYPVHLVMENVVRRPLVMGINLVEKYRIDGWVKWLLLWHKEKIAILPTFFYEFGFHPSVGIYIVADDLTAPGQHLSFHGGFSTDNWVQLSTSNHIQVFRDGSGSLFLNARYHNRPDLLFFGIGSDSEQSGKSYWGSKLLELEMGLTGEIKELNQLSISQVYRQQRFFQGQWPSVEQKHDLAEVPGLNEGYRLISTRLQLDLDSRHSEPQFSTGTGVRLSLFSSFNTDPEHTQLMFGRWGAEGGVFFDLTGLGHVLGLKGYVELIEQIGNVAVPFTELISLGGLKRMKGFTDGRFRGPSAFVMTMDYQYPIWTFLDANIFISLGNTFQEHLSDFAFKRQHLNWGLSLRTSFERAYSFDFVVGVGSNRLDKPSFKIDGVNLAIGINHGF